MEKSLIENVAPHSVTLSTTAKGKTQVEVKIYAATPAEAARLALETLASVKTQLGDSFAAA